MASNTRQGGADAPPQEPGHQTGAAGQGSVAEADAEEFAAELGPEDWPFSDSPAEDEETTATMLLSEFKNELGDTTTLAVAILDTGADDDSHELAVGVHIGGFHIVDRIGQGGCSTVYKAERESDGEIVALKVLHPGLAAAPQQVQRLFQEADAVRIISHPAIVEVFDAGYLDPQRPYLSMELCAGESLTRMLEQSGRLALDEALEILEPVCDALSQAHAVGIVHRDIKAGNVLIEQQDGRRVVKLLDFGVAKLLHDRSSNRVETSVGMVLGSLHSLAPEQITGHPVDGRTDIYALGVLLYKMLTGRHPFHSHDHVSLMQMHLRAEPPKPSQIAAVPAGLDAVIHKAMAKRPADRYASVLDFLRDARAATAEQRTEQHTGQRPDRADALAWAVYVDGRSGDGDILDDDLLVDLLDVVDCAAYELESAGMGILMRTDHALLAATPANSGDDKGRAQVLDTVRALHAALLERPTASERTRVNVCLHLCRADVDPARRAIVGGEVFDVDRWAPKEARAGIQATRQALHGLDHAPAANDAIEYLVVDPTPNS